jgi:hypothetical protein
MMLPRTALLLVVIGVLSTCGVLQAGPPTPSRIDGLAAWNRVYSVVSSPRCINCHTAVQYPQQGDDRHRHLFNVVRGPSNAGVVGLNCGTCHQSSNADSTGVPGAMHWQLAPLTMKWQDAGDRVLPSPQVCRIIVSEAKRHHLDLVQHHAEEALVRWAFQPGLRNDGTPRNTPPLTHEQFVDATRTWVAAGSPCPER